MIAALFDLDGTLIGWHGPLAGALPGEREDATETPR